MPDKQIRISVVGLGKLGCPMAAVFASKGFHVIGADSDPEKVKAVRESKAPTYEPGLQDLIGSLGDSLTATTDVAEAVSASNVTFVVVPTPSKPDGGFSNEYVLSACEAIGQALREKPGFHLVVISSTVTPGTVSGEVLPSLERASSKECGVDWGLCYGPQFIALGSVINDLLNPDFLLIGESDQRSGDILESFYRSVCATSPKVSRMNFVNAELTKIAVNTFVTTKISFANMIARLCEELPGAHTDVVTSALGLDSRVGPKYLRGAVGYGGPCFPRDNLALSALGRQIGVPALLAEATDKANRTETTALADLIKGRLRDGGTAGILGLAYKPDTDVVDEAAGVLLAQHLTSEGIPVIVFDPAAMDNARKILGGSVRFAGSLEECLQDLDVAVITTPWQQFRDLDPELIRQTHAPRVLIDCWRILDPIRFESLTCYVGLGIGPVHTGTGPTIR